jgi:hypothetical protein
MGKYRIRILLIIIVLFTGMAVLCEARGNGGTTASDKLKGVLYQMRSNQSLLHSGKARLARDLYNGVSGMRIDMVQEALVKGADPNYCIGEFGWQDSNPLNVISWYPTYFYFEVEFDIPNPTPEIAIVNYLVDNGADINKRPYVWSVVYHSGNEYIQRIERRRKLNNEAVDSDSIKREEGRFVDDVNRLLQIFLIKGADPDKLGHPYPYSKEAAINKTITEEQANIYFSNGTRAINIAIEKGMKWEKQVDLLLQYTKLDEDSINAAERSNDPAMQEKISMLWQMQIEQTH